MSKEEVLAEFDIDLKDPVSLKDGEYLYEQILVRAKRTIINDRIGMVEVLRYWLSLRKALYTMMAVDLIKDLVISELKPELNILMEDIESGKVFLPYYKQWVDRALKAIS
jgi:hypothetical protein